MIKGILKKKMKSIIKELIEELIDLAKDAEPYVGKDSNGKVIYGVKIRKEF